MKQKISLWLSLSLALIASLCLMFFSISCGGGQGNTSSSNIVGKVLDKDGNPAANVSVSLRTTNISTASIRALSVQSATSGADGSFVFNNVADGTYNVECDQSDTYKVIKTNIVYVAGNAVDLGSLTLAKTGAITGKALFMDKTNHLGISVFIPGTSFTAITDATGAYTIIYVPQGTFALYAQCSGYNYASKEGVPVSSESTTTVSNMILIPIAGGATSSVTFIVTNSVDSSPILGANVVVGGVSQMTDVTGVTTLEPIFVGSQHFTVTKTGYQDYSGVVNVIGGITVSQPVSMQPFTYSVTPTGLSAVTVSSSTVEVMWTTVTDSDFSGCNLYRSTSSGGTFTKINSSLITDNNFTDSGLTANTTYYYKINAVNKIGGEGAYTSTVSATTNSIVIPTGLSVTPESISAIRATWNAVTDSDYSGYNLYRSTSASGTFAKINSVPLTTNTYTDSSLSAGTIYYYKICALNAIGEEGSQSSAVSGYTLINVPTGLAASAYGPAITLNWTACTGTNVAGYNIYRNVTSEGTFTKVNGSLVTSASYQDNGLSNKTTYYYKVTAVDNYSNTSGYSAQASAYVYSTGFNWTQATAAAGFSERDELASLVYDNKMWVIGGEIAYVGDARDVWYSTNGIAWTQATSEAGFSATYHTSMVYDNKMWVIDLNSNVWFSTDGISWTQTTAEACGPTSAYPTCLVYDNKMWVFGLWAVSGYPRKDVWYSTDGITWTQATANAGFGARTYSTSLVYDNKMWVIAGQTNTGYVNDVWYSTDGISWTRATANAGFNCSGSYPTSYVYDNKMWVIDKGGSVWHSTDGISWTQAIIQAGFGARGWPTSMVYDNKTWVIGGNVAYPVYKNDVWWSN